MEKLLCPHHKKWKRLGFFHFFDHEKILKRLRNFYHSAALKKNVNSFLCTSLVWCCQMNNYPLATIKEIISPSFFSLSTNHHTSELHCICSAIEVFSNIFCNKRDYLSVFFSLSTNHHTSELHCICSATEVFSNIFCPNYKYIYNIYTSMLIRQIKVSFC